MQWNRKINENPIGMKTLLNEKSEQPPLAFNETL